MAQYVYTILNSEKQTKDGILEASSYDSAFKTLSEKYGTVLEIREIKTKKGVFAKKISMEDIMVITYQMAAMLKAGLTLRRTIEIVAADTENSNLQIILVDINSGLSEGKSLSQMLSKYPNIFSSIYISMTKAGEHSGKLPEILTKLAEYIENAETLKQKVKSALYYPLTVVFLAFFLALFIFVFGVKQFEEIYTGLGAQLPPATLLLINTGNFIYTHSIIIAILLFIAVYALGLYFKSDNGTMLKDRLLLSLPILSPIMQRLAIARFSRTLSVLYEGGVSIVNSLELVSTSMGNRILEKVVLDALKEVKEGESITLPLRKSQAFTKMAVGMIATGEESGTLALMLDELARFYEMQVDVMLRALAGLVEPFVIIFVGIFVGILIIALGMPLLNLIQVLV